MPTIGEVYNPLIEAAEKDDSVAGQAILREVGELIFLNNRDRCPSIEDGIEHAKQNLCYYCQYFSAETAALVKRFYGVDPGFKPLTPTIFTT